MPSARTLPERMCASAAGTTEIVMCTCPAIVSVSAGVTPLYGTCCTSMPAMCLNSSADRCGGEPEPPEP